MEFVHIENLAGAPIIHDWAPPSRYGEGGTQIRPSAPALFAATAEAAIGAVDTALKTAGLGAIRAVLVSGSESGSEPESDEAKMSQLKLDGLVLSTRRAWVAGSFPEAPHFYLGVEAILRGHFDVVLTYGHTADHHDHILCGDETLADPRMDARSRILFLQHALFYLFDLWVEPTGTYDCNTKFAERLICKEHDLPPLSDRGAWRQFLTLATRIAFERAAPEPLQDLVA